MLNVEHVRQEINVHEHLIVSIDVSKDRLDGFATHRTGSSQQRQVEFNLPNRTEAIEHQLGELAEYADDQNLQGLWVICEPTGGFERTLLRTARRLGHRTAYVNSEHVAKMSVVDTGDSNKTDRADARVISLVARLDRTQKDRQLTDEYALLRKLGQMYEHADSRGVQLRSRLNDQIQELFCDYGKRVGFLYESTGQAVMEVYSWNPHRIVADGYETFERQIRERVRGVEHATLEELWTQARSSARRVVPEAYLEMLEQRVRQLWDDYFRQRERKAEIQADIERLYRRLEDRGEAIPPVEQLTRKQLGRLIGETGPLADFSHWRELLAYAGLKLRERDSGQYQGEIKITKKGRPLMRKILSQMAYTLSFRDRLFADYYQRKQAEGMNAIKARVAVMRKITKFLFGLWRSDEPYDRKRVFTCEAEYDRAS